MTSFFEIFNPGERFQRQQRDHDKTYVMEQKKGGRGPLQIDLDKGTMVVKPRTGHQVSTDEAEAGDPSDD